MEVEGQEQPSPLKGQQALFLMDKAEQWGLLKIFHIRGRQAAQLGFVPGGQAGVLEVRLLRQMPLAVGVSLGIQPFRMPELIAHEIEIARVRRGQGDQPHQTVKSQAARDIPVFPAHRHIMIHVVAHQPPDHGVVAVDALIVALHIADGAVIGPVVGHLMPQAAHVMRGLDAFFPVVGNAHGKTVVKAQTALMRRAGQAGHAGKLFGNGYGLRPQLMGQGVGQAEIEFTVFIRARFAVFAVKATPHMRKIIVHAVIVVEHVAHRVKAEAVHVKLFQPVAAVGEEKAARHFLAVVKGGGAPLIELFAEKVKAAVVAGQALLRIGAGVAVGYIQNHGQAQTVGGIHQRLELVRRAIARTGREITADLIAEGAVQGVLQNAHELHGGVAARLDPGQDGATEFLICAHTFAVMAQGGLGHAHMGLINAREYRRAGTAVAKAVGLPRGPEPRAPLRGHGLVLFHPLGEGGNTTQGRRAQAFSLARSIRLHGELNAQLHIVAVRQGIRRQNQFKNAVCLALETVTGMALEVQPVRGQPDFAGLGHVFAPTPAVHASAVLDAVRPQAGMQIGIGAQ